jgi:hypothetical protein
MAAASVAAMEHPDPGVPRCHGVGDQHPPHVEVTQPAGGRVDQQPMSGGHHDIRGTAQPKQRGRGFNCRPGGDHVVDDHRRSAAHRTGDVGCGDRRAACALLTHHRHRTIQNRRIAFGEFHRAQVGRDNHRCFRQFGGQPTAQDGYGAERRSRRRPRANPEPDPARCADPDARSRSRAPPRSLGRPGRAGRRRAATAALRGVH